MENTEEIKVNDSMKNRRIRPLAVAIVKRGNKVLVMPGYDAVKKENFYRLPGGGIEFGEYAEQTIKREFMEEIGIEPKVGKKLGVFENILQFHGFDGHEIIIIYEAKLPDEYMEKDKFPMIEEEFKGKFFEFVEINPNNKIYPEIF